MPPKSPRPIHTKRAAGLLVAPSGLDRERLHFQAGLYGFWPPRRSIPPSGPAEREEDFQSRVRF